MMRLLPWARLALAALLLAAFGLTAASAPAVAKPSRLAEQVKSATKKDRVLRPFYAARGFAPLWVGPDGPGEGAHALARLIADAHLDGLNPASYRIGTLQASLQPGRRMKPKALAKAELAFSTAYVAYARDTARVANSGTVYADKSLTPEPPSAGALLRAAAAAPSLRDHVASMQWMNPLYVSLRQGAAAERERGGASTRFRIPPGPALKAGQSGQRVWLLRQRLGLSGGISYDPTLVAAVREFQAARGIPVDGIAGPRTISALNEAAAIDPSTVVRANLERVRALPANPGRRYILVDAGAAKLWMYENGRAVDSMRVVVGKPSEPTPMLASTMRYAILNPYWNVPPDLARKIIAPAVVAKGPAVLKTLRYQVLSDWTANPRVLNPRAVDWKAVAAGRQEVRLRQLPGKDNAMGQVKFMLPNDLGIYLHDSPKRQLFKEDERFLSAGCVRLEDAPKLARWIFGRTLTAPSKAPEQRVELPEPVPVYITYTTAVPTAAGLVVRPDPYGRDAAPKPPATPEERDRRR